MVYLAVFICLCFLLVTFLYIDFNKTRKLHKFEIDRTHRRLDNAWLRFRTFEKRIRKVEQQVGWDDSNNLTQIKEE